MKRSDSGRQGKPRFYPRFMEWLGKLEACGKYYLSIYEY